MKTRNMKFYIKTLYCFSGKGDEIMKKVAILQSNYIPWKGYFDMINMVDEFILYDEAQYTKNDWRNRNKIKTQNGVQWISIPVLKENLSQKINETKIIDQRWKTKHWKTLHNAYSKANQFRKYSDYFEEIYSRCDETFLSEVNYKFIIAINKVLDISTRISYSSEYTFSGDKTDKLISILQEAKAEEYLSGPAAKNYIDEDAFLRAGIKLTYMDYSDYPEYPQLFGEFEHGVTILDLIFNTGKDAKKYMRSFQK